MIFYTKNTTLFFFWGGGGESGGRARGLELLTFCTKFPNLKKKKNYFCFWEMGWGMGGARVSIFFT